MPNDEIMRESYRGLLEALPHFLTQVLPDATLAPEHVPPVLREVVRHRAEEADRLDRLDPYYYEELVGEVLADFCRRSLEDAFQMPEDHPDRERVILSRLLIRAQYLGAVVDGKTIKGGGQAIDHLRDLTYLAQLCPPDTPPSFLEELGRRFESMMDTASRKQTGTVGGYRKAGLESLARAIWEAHEEIALRMTRGTRSSEPLATILPAGTRQERVHQAPPGPSLVNAPQVNALNLESTVSAAPLEGSQPEEGSNVELEPSLRDGQPRDWDRAAGCVSEDGAGGDAVADVEAIPGPDADPVTEGDREAERLTRLRRPLWPGASSYVTRPGLVDEIKRCLLQPCEPAVVALWGMAGAGKTALLQMLWNDPEIQERFDFPLWADLGLEADESRDASRARVRWREQLSRWGDALSLPAARVSGEESLSRALREHLQARAHTPLILLDDAWSADSVRPFLVAGKVVVTTRNRTLLEGLGVPYQVLEIPPLTAEEAQLLVQEVTGQELEASEPALHFLYQQTGGLPQALKAAGLRLRELGWDRVLQALQEESSRLALFEQGEGRSRVDSLRASFALSYQRLRSEQQSLFRCLGILVAPAAAEMVLPLWEQGSVELVTIELLRLADLGLVQRRSLDDGTLLFGLPGLWRDYARALLRENSELEALEARYVADQVGRAELLAKRYSNAGNGMAALMRGFVQALPELDHVYRLACQRRDLEHLLPLLIHCPPLLLQAGGIDIWQAWLALLEPWLGQAPVADETRVLVAEWTLQRAELLLEQEHGQEALAVLKEMKQVRNLDPGRTARRLLLLASATLELGRARQARQALAQAQKLSCVHLDSRLRCWLLSLQARLARTTRIPTHIAPAHGRALLACHAENNVAGELAERLHLAENYRQFGWVDKALAQLEQVAIGAGQLDLFRLYVLSLSRLAELSLDAGQVQRAAGALDLLRPLCPAGDLAPIEERLESTMPIKRAHQAFLHHELARRIVLVGAPGSAATDLARRLSQQLGWPCIDLESMYWRSGWKPILSEVFRDRVRQAVGRETWIAAGDSREVRDLVWGRTDLILWLDYAPHQVLMQGIRTLWQRVTGRQANGGTFPNDQRAVLFVRAVQGYWRWREGYLLRQSLDGIEQFLPHVVYLSSPRAADLWRDEFLAARRRRRINS